MANNPQCHKELLEEQVQIHKNNENSYYSIEQIAKMVKLDSFVKETLRVNANTGKFYIFKSNNQIKDNSSSIIFYNYFFFSCTRT